MTPEEKNKLAKINGKIKKLKSSLAVLKKKR